MRVKIIHFFVFVVAAGIGLLITSCGGGGNAGNPGSVGLDKTWAVLTASIAPGSDHPGDTGRDVDIFRTADCDGNAETVDPEPFTDHSAQITFTLTSGNKDIPTNKHIIEGYRIDYTTETLGAPPIQSFTSGSQTVVLDPDTTTTAQALLLDLGRKLKLADDITSGIYDPQYVLSTYTAVYTFFGKDIFGNPFTTVVQTNFEAGNFDFCRTGGQ